MVAHVRLETEVRRPFKKDPMKTFKAPCRKFSATTPNFFGSHAIEYYHGVLSMCQAEFKIIIPFLSYLRKTNF